jgi:hypothetical protein
MAQTWAAASPEPVAGGGAMSLFWLAGLFGVGLWLRRS